MEMVLAIMVKLMIAMAVWMVWAIMRDAFEEVVRI